MMKTIRELGVKISLAYSKSSASEVSQGVDNIANKMKSMGLAVGAAAGTIFGLTEATALNARDLLRNSKAIGMNVEMLQEYIYAGKIAAGLTEGEMVGAFEGLSSTMDKVRKGDVSASDTLVKTLGFSAQAIQKMTAPGASVSDVFLMITDRIAALPGGMIKSAAAAEIFGSSLGGKLTPLIEKGAIGVKKLGSEIHKKGEFFTEKDLVRQNKFQEQMLKTLNTLRHTALVIGDKLMPMVLKVINQFNVWLNKNRAFIASGIGKFLTGLGEAVGIIWQYALKAADAFVSLAEYMGGSERAAKALLVGFAAFKGLQIANSIIQLGVAFASLATSAFPIIAMVAGLTSLVAIVHDLWAMLKGGDLKDTWLGQMGDKLDQLTGGKLNIGDKIYNYFKGDKEDELLNARMNGTDKADKKRVQQRAEEAINPSNAPSTKSSPKMPTLQNMEDLQKLTSQFRSATPGGSVAVASGGFNQTNNINTNINIGSAAGANVGALSDAVADANSKKLKESMNEVYRKTADAHRGGAR